MSQSISYGDELNAIKSAITRLSEIRPKAVYRNLLKIGWTPSQIARIMEMDPAQCKRTYGPKEDK